MNREEFTMRQRVNDTADGGFRVTMYSIKQELAMETALLRGLPRAMYATDQMMPTGAKQYARAAGKLSLSHLALREYRRLDRAWHSTSHPHRMRVKSMGDCHTFGLQSTLSEHYVSGLHVCSATCKVITSKVQQRIDQKTCYLN